MESLPFPSPTLPMFGGLENVSELEIQSTEMFFFFFYDGRYMAFTSNFILTHILSWRNFSGRERESKEHSQGQKCISAHFKYSLKPNFNCISFKCDRREISHLMKWLFLLFLTMPFSRKHILMYMKQRNWYLCSNLAGLVQIFFFHNCIFLTLVSKIP